MFIPFSYQMSVRMTTYDDFISSYGKLQMSSKMLMSSKLLMYFFYSNYLYIGYIKSQVCSACTLKTNAMLFGSPVDMYL